jgi:hypothetical protein
MNVDDLRYPVLAQTKYGLSCMAGPHRLTVGFVRNVRSGYYKDLRIIGFDGVTYRVSGITEQGWVGPFWGFSILYSRRVRLGIEVVRAEEQLSLEDVKEVILRDFKKSPEWLARGDFEELKMSVIAAETTGELIRAIC